jgi:hypothetical protein
VSAQAVNPSAGVGYVKYLNNPPQGVSGSIILEAILLKTSDNSIYQTQNISINITVDPSFSYLTITNSNITDYIEYGQHEAPYQHYGKAEFGVFKTVYELSYTKANDAIPDSDIIFEYTVLDDSQTFTGKQFLLSYDYDASRKKVTILSNDILDSYDSYVKVIAKRKSTNKYISQFFQFFVTGINH